ncbi:hypothetical protein AFCDBAGC_4800 [Methylobacterium cerastii]|uniref:FecR protein domain-containing protein n=1 Tax=Methylobacterium cerastii TaxID=932741 RepID=A0ABQ4QQ31_9HYPH|nr:FecR family protein [Methylobacterium cerastii]GJD46915.1 hypothetical protein AFCDBAGC_4800 [Methylobacterium cerastii]
MNRLCIVSLTIAMVGTGLPALAAPETIGAIEKVQADATASQGHETRALAPTGPLLFKDKLRTGPGARLEAKLEDGTVLTLGEKGRMTVDEFVYKPGYLGGAMSVKVAQGAFLFVGGKVEGPTGGNVVIETPVGTLGVRGTTVWGGQIDKGYGVLVLDGEVEVTTNRGKVLLKKGQGTMIYGGKAPMQAGPWPEDRTTRAVQTISFAKPQ